MTIEPRTYLSSDDDYVVGSSGDRPLSANALIYLRHYQALAEEINRLFSDNYSSASYYGDKILETTVSASGVNAGETYTLSPTPHANDYLVVHLDGETQFLTTDYTLSDDQSEITFENAISGNTEIIVYNKERHRYGWGQDASVTYDTTDFNATDDSAEETVLISANESEITANLNNLIDKLNIINQRINSPNEFINRINPGKIIDADDKQQVIEFINDEILDDDNYWTNVETLLRQPESITRYDGWEDQLDATIRWEWTSYQNFRYFFNSGGNIQFRIEMTGDPYNRGYSDWVQVANSAQTVVMDVQGTRSLSNTGQSSDIGVYDLSEEWHLVYQSNSPTNPSEYITDNSNDLRIKFYARIHPTTRSSHADGTSSIGIDIRVVLDDTPFTGNNRTIQGQTIFRGGFLGSTDLSRNTASFSNSGLHPSLSEIDDFDGTDDT